MLSFAPKSYSKRLLPIISWSHWFTFFNILAVIALSIIYLIAEGAPDTLLGKAYLILNWLSHMAFLTFMAFVIFIFPIILILPKTRFIRVFASIVFTFGLLLLLLDAYIYSALGYHLNASSTEQIIELITFHIQEDTRFFVFVSILSTLLILSFELVVSNYAWKHLRNLQKTSFSRYIIGTLVAAFFISHFTHIWADAKLEYEVLRQDSTLPLSYPSTAKTLLTKYGLFDRKAYMERRAIPLALNVPVPQYPTLPARCTADKPLSQSTFLILNSDELSSAQQAQFAKRTDETHLVLQHHIDNALPNNAWFNLLFGLPTIYKENLIDNKSNPLLFQWLNKYSVLKTFTTIGDYEQSLIQEDWLLGLFDKTNELSDISSLVFKSKLNDIPVGLHVIMFKPNNQYQFEVFVDAFLLAQKQKLHKDNIWISSIGNQTAKSRFASKPALLILPNTENKTLDKLTSHMDVQHTLLKYWLDCPVLAKTYTNATDLFRVNHNRVIANTTPNNSIMAFSKDKSVLINQTGHFESYSSQLEAPIEVSSDLPLMIDAVHYIKQFSQQAKNEQ